MAVGGPLSDSWAESGPGLIRSSLSQLPGLARTGAGGDNPEQAGTQAPPSSLLPISPEGADLPLLIEAQSTQPCHLPLPLLDTVNPRSCQ